MFEILHFSGGSTDIQKREEGRGLGLRLDRCYLGARRPACGSVGLPQNFSTTRAVIVTMAVLTIKLAVLFCPRGAQNLVQSNVGQMRQLGDDLVVHPDWHQPYQIGFVFYSRDVLVGRASRMRFGLPFGGCGPCRGSL